MPVQCVGVMNELSNGLRPVVKDTHGNEVLYALREGGGGGGTGHGEGSYTSLQHNGYPIWVLTSCESAVKVSDPLSRIKYSFLNECRSCNQVVFACTYIHTDRCLHVHTCIQTGKALHSVWKQPASGAVNITYWKISAIC